MNQHGVFVKRPNRRIDGQRRTETQDRRKHSMVIANCRRNQLMDRRAPQEDRRFSFKQPRWVHLAVTKSHKIERQYAPKGKKVGKFVDVCV